MYSINTLKLSGVLKSAVSMIFFFEYMDTRMFSLY